MVTGALPVLFELNPVQIRPPLNQGKLLSVELSVRHFDRVDADTRRAPLRPDGK
jgi:hypothetical protein